MSSAPSSSAHPAGGSGTSAPRPRAADPRPARTRQAVLDAMMRLAAGGTGDITVFSLAKEAGISRAAFYTHFSDLEDVAIAMIRPALEGLEGLDEADRAAGLEPAERGMRSLLRVIGVLVDRAEVVRVVSRWKVSAAVDSMITAAYANRFEEILRQYPAVLPGTGGAEEQRRYALFLAGGLFVSLATWLTAEPQMPLEEVRDRARGMVEHLLRIAASAQERTGS
ncbi:TetR/AcrR family transcriptional regulator [Brachybacterium hainanense]|uniref:TetR/AcrR family transcriptional regulator n=1 Tax=Brachybacterium hainanense TaxID=1541174 RepID=A0ABV6R692_9MICO